jgi:FtsZ-interacting cell division protein ZipA
VCDFINNLTPPRGSSPKIAAAVIAGIVGIVIVVLVAALLVYRWRQRRRRRVTHSSSPRSLGSAVLQNELKSESDSCTDGAPTVISRTAAPARHKAEHHGALAEDPAAATAHLVELVYQRLQQDRPTYESIAGSDSDLPRYAPSAVETTVLRNAQATPLVNI